MILALAVSVNLSAHTFIAGTSVILLSSVTVPTITAIWSPYNPTRHSQTSVSKKSSPHITSADHNGIYLALHELD